MASTRVKPVTPEHWQVVLVQKGAPLVLRVTVRDRFGAPLPNMSVSMTQNGQLLSGPAKQSLKTDVNGRVDVAGFDGGTLTFLADPTYVPPDTTDTRGGQPQRYTYTPARMTLPKTSELVPAEDGSTSDKKYFLDTANAYVTVFCDVSPWSPAHRFPWQNPVHLSGDDPIYAKRLDMLRSALAAFGKRPAQVAGLDHAGLVGALVDLYESDTLLGGARAPAPAATPAATSVATGDARPPADATPADPPASHPVLPPPNEPAEPPPPSEPHPERSPLPTDVRVRATNIAPDSASTNSAALAFAPAGAPSNTPGTAPNPNALPHWVWYMIFHYTGLRYSPAARSVLNGAHGSYLDPSLLLELLRGVDIDATWANPTGKTPVADPDPSDVTEALALVNEANIGEFADVPAGRVKDYLFALTSSDNKKVVGALRKIFLSMASKGRIHTDGQTDPRQPLLNGDHFALGLLKARHLVKPLSADDLKALTSYTLLRNDVPADGWELASPQINAFGAAVSAGLNRHTFDAWKERHLQTLDLVSNSAVCNQLSEFGEQTRSNTDPPGGIPANARRASQSAALMLLTPTNAPRIQTGMHVFFSAWKEPKPGEQRYVDADMSAEKWWLNRAAGAQESDAVDASTVVQLPPQWTFDSFTKRKPEEAADRAKLVGLWKLDLATFWADKYGDNKSGMAFALIDDGGDRIQTLKWSHQEIVIGTLAAAKDTPRVYTYSTAAPKAAGGYGLGIRTHLVGSANSTPSALVGFLSPSSKDRDDLLLPCYLDVGVLRQLG